MSKETEEVLEAVGRLITDERFGARVTVVAGGEVGASAAVDLEEGVVAGHLPEPGHDILKDAGVLVERETPATLGYGEVEVFIEPVVPRPRLVIFGAVHIAQALAAHAALLGFHVTVSDARAAFLTEERFPGVDDLLVGWPDEVADKLVLDRRTSVVVLSHDARFEEPLWPVVLPTPVRYIGAMGSKGTAQRRREALAEAGHSKIDIERIHGPVGLDIGADSPGEVAIAILAEMVATLRRPEQAPELRGERRPIARRP
jgi:xanthine dehydrogenase accessory factor